MNFKIDLSKNNIGIKDYSEIEKLAKEEVSKQISIGIEKLSVDHFYDMSDFGGSKDLYVLEISHDYDEDTLNTCVLKEIGNLVFEVTTDF